MNTAEVRRLTDDLDAIATSMRSPGSIRCD